MKKVLTFLFGAVLGMAALGVAVYLLMPGMMLKEQRSPCGVEDTVARQPAVKQ